MNVFVGGEREYAELPAIRAMVGWGPGAEFLPLLGNGTARLLCVRDASDRLVATGLGVAFRPAGFIGSMITQPELQGQGIGRRVFAGLMEWLTANGVTRVDLEATAAGRPLYERHFGFKVRWESFRATLEAASPLPPDPVVRSATSEADWAGIAALDFEAYGGDRISCIRAAAGASDSQVVVLEDGGVVVAYGMRRGERLGPVIGRDAEGTARVVRTLIAGAGGPISCGTGGHVGVRAFWEGLGFTISPYDTRMTWGAEPDDRPEFVYGLLSGGLG